MKGLFELGVLWSARPLVASDFAVDTRPQALPVRTTGLSQVAV